MGELQGALRKALQENRTARRQSVSGDDDVLAPPPPPPPTPMPESRQLLPGKHTSDTSTKGLNCMNRRPVPTPLRSRRTVGASESSSVLRDVVQGGAAKTTL